MPLPDAHGSRPMRPAPGLYVQNAAGDAFRLEALDPASIPKQTGLCIPSTRILSLRPLPAVHALRHLLWDFHPVAAAEPAALIGLGVRRVSTEDQLLPGEVIAIRGAAELVCRATDHSVIVRDLIEVRFHDERREPGCGPEHLPPLSADDAGAVIVSAYGEAIGLVVGGSGYRAAVAPVGPFLAEHELQLVNATLFDRRGVAEKRRRQLDLEVTSLVEDFATTSPYPFGDPLDEAA
jgi:hypothetical protein